ncbi:hypothetical protein BH09MYX1_BH09MYX1_06950 [soil metagenome]
MEMSAEGASRRVFQGEALGWLSANPADPAASVITSLPDVSEIPTLDLAAWRVWFVEAARAVIRWIPPANVAIFYQSDILDGGEWVDKGYLVQRAAELEGAILVFHKIVCRKPPGTIGIGRPTYSHMIAVTRESRGVAVRPGPDVLPDAGAMGWSKAMGLEACRVACEFLRDETATRVVVDPFCGRGSVLAVANALGFDAIGVDLVASRCRVARNATYVLADVTSPERPSAL